METPSAPIPRQATLAGWTDIMEVSIDAVGIDQAPQEM